MLNKGTNSSEDYDSPSFMSKVFGVMGVSTLLSFITAFMVAKSSLINSITVLTMILALIIEIALLIVVHVVANNHPHLAIGVLLLFSIVSGATMSVLFAEISIKYVEEAFLVATVTFGAMSLIGMKTQKELNWGRYLFGALIALIIADFIEIFVFSSVADLIISSAGVLIFSAYSVYDAQKIQEAGYDTNGSLGVVAVGALEMYLDFINLFVNLVSIFVDASDINN